MSNMNAYLKAIASDSSLKIVTDEAVLAESVSKNHSRTRAVMPAAIVYPVSVEQTEAVIRAANEYEINITVRSSTGWDSLTGTSLPWREESIILNMSEMNRIIHIDPLNNMAVVEAGVTFAQLNEALEKEGLYMEHPLQVKAGKSVVAALLDRDPVLTAKHLWDVPDPLCAMKMVFGNGRVFGSGSAAGPGTLEEMLEAGCAMNQAQGPVWLDFGRVITGAQGTLAAVCWASVKVRPIGSCRTMTYVQSDDIGVLGTYASQVIRRRLGEEAVILNKKGLQVILGIDAAAAAEMPEWTYLSSVRGFRFFPEEYMNNQIEDMAEIAGKYGLKLATDINGISSEDAYKALDGHSAKGDFWKLRGGEKIVDLFMINTIGKIEKFERIAAGAVKLAGLNPEDLIVYAQPSQMARNCHIEFLIPAGEKAAELEKSMGMALLDNKAFYSRPYGSMEPEIYEKYKNQRHYMPAIKAVFDAKGIMNPGKLEDGYKGGEI